MTATARLLAVAASLAFAAPARADQGPDAGNFQSYVFVLEWLPQFCARVPSSAECTGLSAGSFGASHLVLHGLWPNQAGDSSHSYGFCGAAIDEKPLDDSTTWCQLTLPALSNPTRANLDKYMPGTASCLEHHEWTRHGTCSGLSADAYFGAEADLAAVVDGSSFGQYAASNPGGTIDRATLLSRFDASFGSGASASVTLHCVKSKGQPRLNEIHITLNAALLPADQLASMLAAPDPSDSPDPADKDYCPATIGLLSPR
jgi:ribonuclease T2